MDVCTQPTPDPGAPADDAPQPAESRAAQADMIIAQRLRERRRLLGVTQQQLADLTGITCQQVHKYERGANRISAGRLYQFAAALGAPVAWFFDGIDHGGAVPDLNAAQLRCLDLIRDFARFADPHHQDAFAELVRALAARNASA